jgi:hypothetical protein
VNRERLIELADRAEAATGPDRELDAVIAEAVATPYGSQKEVHFENQSFSWSEEIASRYTASLDAAMTLAPENCSRRVELHPDLNRAYAEVFSADDGGSIGKGRAITMPLALVSAALRALAQEAGDADMA